jgi:amino acid adenylation domain-containing protein
MNTTNISRIQEQFWLLQKVYKDNSAYNIPSVFKIKGQLNFPALNKAFSCILKKHNILRSFFIEENNSVCQKMLDFENDIFSIDIVKAEKGKNDIPVGIYEEINKPFALNQWPLFRVKLFRITDSEWFLTIVFHHILVDLHTKDIFSKELSEYYSIFNKNIDSVIDLIPDSCSEYASWLNTWLQSPDAKSKIASWENELSVSTDTLELPTDFQRPKLTTLEGKRLLFNLSQPISNQVNNFAKEHNLNSFTVMLAAYAVFLSKLTMQKRISIGVPLTNRKNEQFKDTFGCFVNIVPVFIDFEDNDTIESIVIKVRKQLLFAHRRQEVPFLNINDIFRRNNNSRNMFQAGFAFEHPMKLELAECLTETVLYERDGAQLDLFLTLWEQADGIYGFLEYSTQLFTEKTVERFRDIYLKTVNAFITRPNQMIVDIDILPDSDAELLSLWNNTDHEYNKHLCLHQKFEQQVAKTPKAAALIYNDQTLTYEELNQHANRLANHLIDKGVNIEDKIGVCQERSLELIISILGIHKAGATYVPIDPGYPEDRMQMILEDANPKHILTKKNSSSNIPANFSKIFVDNILSEPLSDNESQPNVNVNSNNLAYIIFTSGSTGRPKGVMIEHHSVINKIEWMQYQHPLKENDTLLLKTPITFDVSVWELFWWYFNGSKLAILPPQAEKDPKTIIEVVEKNKVTLIIFVPSMFSYFLGYLKANQLTASLKSLKWIVQIGEALSSQLVNSFNELLNHDFNPLMVNTYGPAEATVAVTYYNCPKEEVNNVYIGKPIFNTKIFIINSANRVLPIGVPGELVITGVNLARGYINRPELNREKFIEIEYSGQKFRAYKTGDLARWLDNGNLDFIGRVDNQVKIRGYRIELGDIEAVLQQCPLVKSAAVIVDGSNPENKVLNGYITLKQKNVGTTEAVKDFLLTKLPEYMIPTHLMILDEMPLNRSEKIDRKALPKPAYTSANAVTPGSYFEVELSKIWKEVLNLPEVGVLDNFFDVGGNSLLAIQVSSNIKINLNFSIEPLKLMEYPTIRDLAKYIHLINNKNETANAQNDSVTTRKADFSLLRKKRL